MGACGSLSKSCYGRRKVQRCIKFCGFGAWAGCGRLSANVLFLLSEMKDCKIDAGSCV